MKQKLCLGDNYALSAINNTKHKRKQSDHGLSQTKPLADSRLQIADNEKSCVQTLAQAPALPGLGLALGAILLSLAAFCNQAYAHPWASKPIDSITPLQIGDTIPEYLWHLPLQVVNHPEGKETITLADYKDKLIILDFWATWCAPCVKSLYKLDTLQGQFRDDLVIIPTTYEDADKAAPFFDEKGWELPTAVSQTELKKFFPHRSIPHQVWIKEGEVLAVAGYEYANSDFIGKVLQGQPVDFNHKIEVEFNKSKPLFLNGNGGDGSNMLYQSVISGRLQAMVAGVSRPSPNEILAYNQTVEKLYRIALGDSISPLYHDNYISKYIIHEISDSIKFKINASEILALKDPIKTQEWVNENAYCYNLVLPKNSEKADVNTKMLDELNNFFCNHLGLTVSFETRQLDALSLICVDESQKILTKGGEPNRKADPKNYLKFALRNESIDVLLHFLNSALISSELPIVNETGIEDNIDLEIDLSQNDIQTIRNELAMHGLDLIQKPSPVKMIVFAHCDKPNHTEK